MGKPSPYHKVKIGQTPGDLSPERFREHPSSKSTLRRKSRRQFAEKTQTEIEEALTDEDSKPA